MTGGGWLDLFNPRVLLESLPGGIEVRDFVSDIVDFRYTMTTRKLDRIVLTLANVDMKYANDPRFDGEMRFRVRWGYPGGLSASKDVVAIQVAPNLGAGVPQLVITALDAGQNLTSTGARNWGAVQSSDIAQAIARRHNLTPDIVPSGDRRSEHRVQTGATTDYEFLARLADRINYDFWIDSAGLHFRPLDTSKLPRHRFIYYIDGSSTLKSFHPTVKKGKLHRRSVGGVSADGTPTVEAPVRRSTERALANNPVVNINSARVTASIGENPDLAVLPSPETSPTVRAMHASSAQHQAEMKAVTMSAEIVGYPGIEARDIIDIYVVERRYSGLWRVEEADHRINSSGYETSLKLKRAEVNATSSVQSRVPQNERNAALEASGLVSEEVILINNRTPSARQGTIVRRRSPVAAR